jgi:hypothetical protein
MTLYQLRSLPLNVRLFKKTFFSSLTVSDSPVELILATKSVGRKQNANVFTFFIKQQHGRSYALKPAWQLAVLSVLSFIHQKFPSHPITFPAVTGQ